MARTPAHCVVVARWLLAGILFLAMSTGLAAREDTLQARRPGGATLRIHYSQAEDGLRIRVQHGSREAQRFTVPTDVAHARPGLRDANGDGAPDLWIPIMTGNANTQYAIWRMRPAEGRFVEAGEISGLDFRRDPGGFLVATGRNGCCAVSHEFHRFDAQGVLHHAFTIERRFDAADETPGRRSARSECSVVPAQTSPPRAVERRYCALRPEARPPGQRIR